MREYLLTLFVAAAVTYLLTGPVRKFAIAMRRDAAHQGT